MPQLLCGCCKMSEDTECSFFGFFFFLLLLLVYDNQFNRRFFSMLHFPNKVSSLVIVLEREPMVKNVKIMLRTRAILKQISLVSENGSRKTQAAQPKMTGKPPKQTKN